VRALAEVVPMRKSESNDLDLTKGENNDDDDLA
jgi:hypothetical protein